MADWVSKYGRTTLFGFTLGCFATLSQVLLMREFWAVPGLGELSLGVVLCCWLIYIAAGALLGHYIPFGYKTLFLIFAAGTMLVPAALMLVRFYEFFFHVSQGEPIGNGPFGILCVSATLPGALLSGLLFTAFSRHVQDNDHSHTQLIYVAEGAGAAVSGLLYAFLLSDHVGPLALLSGSLLALASACTGAIRAPASIRTRWLVPLLPLAAAVCSAATNADTHTLAAAFAQLPVRGHYLACRDTRYQRLCLGQSAEQKQLYQDGRLAYVFPDPWARPRPVHLAMCQHDAPQRVLIIGGGVADRVAAAARYHPQEIHYLDFDPEELTFLSPWRAPSDQHLLKSPGVSVHSGYHRAFLHKYSRYFDVILQFATAPLTAAENASHTVSFYRAVARALADDGVFTVVSQGSANVPSPPAAQLLSSRYHTLKSAFPTVVPVIDVETIFFATRRQSLTLSADALHRRLSRADATLPFIVNPEEFLSKRRLQRSLAVVQQYHGEVNVDDHPRTFLHVLELQRWIRKSSLDANAMSTGDWTAAQGGSPGTKWSLGVWGFILLLLAMTLLFAGTPIPGGIMSIATTGLCGLGLEVVLIYWFSVMHGGLYNDIAWLLASFMTGLAAGAAIGHRIPSTRWVRRWADASVIGAIIFAIWLISREFSSPLAFAVAMLLAGMATGVAFPVFFHALKHRTGSAVSFLLGADHLGAAAGAIIVATLWLPDLGLYWTCVLMLLLKVPLLIKN